MATPRMIPDLNPALLMNYRAARSSKTRNAHVAYISDSTGAGTETGGTTAQVLHSVPMQMAAKLKARGISAGANNRFGSASGTFSTLLTMDSRVTSTGAWSQGTHLGAGGNSFSSTATGSMTFTPQDNITKFDIYWRDGAAGRNFTWAVDGGSTTQINSSGTTQVFKTTVTAGSSASHALAIAWVAGTITIIGIDAYDDTNARREISIWNWSIAGATTTQLADNSDTQTGRLAEISSGKSLMTPDLAIIRTGINDWRTSAGVATMIASLTTLVNTCTAASCDVILATPRFDSTFTSTQEDYVTAIKALGPTMGFNVLDARSYFGSFALGNAAGWYSDSVHGDTNGAGYGEEAEFFVRALLTV